jgi:2-amino-4-hydroxy-6-hydroxymethyldihydropteridine diphosphokinase
MTPVFVSLGSNVDAAANLNRAVQALALRCHLVAVSSVYESTAVGGMAQANYLNAAVLIQTDLSAADLKLLVLRPVESLMGRTRFADKSTPCIIDLDLSLYDDQILQIGQRHIPDPDILCYAYVAIPLADLAPLFPHPETGKTLGAIAQSLASSDLVQRLDLSLWPNQPRPVGESK